MRRTWNDDQLKQAVTEADSYREVILNLKLRAVGANYRSVKKHIDRLELDTSHFTHTGNRKAPQKIPNREIFKRNGHKIGTKLRKRVIEAGFLEYKCMLCDNIGTHNGKPLVLHLDHINGDHYDNRKKNLRWLCPNCHSQTPSYAKTSVKAEIVGLICQNKDCGKKFKRQKRSVKIYKNHYCSRRCYLTSSREFQPRPGSRRVDYDAVIAAHAENGSYRKTGMIFGISDVMVKKIVTKYA